MDTDGPVMTGRSDVTAVLDYEFAQVVHPRRVTAAEPPCPAVAMLEIQVSMGIYSGQHVGISRMNRAKRLHPGRRLAEPTSYRARSCIPISNADVRGDRGRHAENVILEHQTDGIDSTPIDIDFGHHF